MNEPNIVLTEHSSAAVSSNPRFWQGRFRGFVLALLAVVLVFSGSLAELVVFALGSDLYSYILLIPAVSGYIVWIGRQSFPPVGTPHRRLAAALLALGLGALLACTIARFLDVNLAAEDRLFITATAFVVTLSGTCAWFLPPRAFRALLFPLGFLFFIVPIPTVVMHHVETFMQHGSAAVARLLYQTAGTAVYYEDLTFQLPGINLHVAPECSGIRSTLVLFIVSVLTGYFFLRSPGKRTALALAIVPLALVRNGFRIFVIGELCVRFGPEMIDSFIHRRGGPLFFGLSLIPLFLLLIVLQRREQKSLPAKSVR